MSSKKIGFLASGSLRREFQGPFHRLVRDRADVLSKFDIFATGGTASSIRATGLYEARRVHTLRTGAQGGVVELAAMVARGDLAAVIFLSDPNDPRSDTPENYALRRVCMQQEVRLLSTLASAEQWVRREAPRLLRDSRRRSGFSLPNTWRPGHESRGGRLPVEQQTIALIAHDNHQMKERMVRFVDKHLDDLARFDRILATGTTGGLLRKRYATQAQMKQIDAELQALGKDRVGKIEATLRDLPKRPRASKHFVDKVMQLPSGPKGGDILIADEVLNHRCQAIVFFHDPQEAHPHEPDIRLLERTCQLRDTYAACVSDATSAEQWVSAIRDPEPAPSTQDVLRAAYGVRETIVAKTKDDEDGDQLGTVVARAAAGYFDDALRALTRERRRVVVGVSYGWGASAVLKALRHMQSEGLVPPLPSPSELIWVPLMGVISVQWTEQEAANVARGFAELYGGAARPIGAAGFALEASAADTEKEALKLVREADIILTSGGPWNSKATIARSTGLNRAHFPKFSDAVGTISGVFLDEWGAAAPCGYHIVGIRHADFQKAARDPRTSVILMVAGRQRRRLALAALRARMVTTLVTSNATAKWLREHTIEETRASTATVRRGRRSGRPAEAIEPAGTSVASPTASRRAQR